MKLGRQALEALRLPGGEHTLQGVLQEGEVISGRLAPDHQFAPRVFTNSVRPLELYSEINCWQAGGDVLAISWFV